jgi:hypothetical protein
LDLDDLFPLVLLLVEGLWGGGFFVEEDFLKKKSSTLENLDPAGGEYSPSTRFPSFI